MSDNSRAVGTHQHSLRYEINCSILFSEAPLLRRADAARAAGFDAVEFWWPFNSAVPSDAGVDAFVTSVRDAGVQLVGLNFFAGDMPAGDRGLVSWVDRGNEFRDNIDVTVGIGEQLGCRAFNALYGNRVEGTDVAQADEFAVANLAQAAQAAARVDGIVLIEPLSGAPDYPLTAAEDALSVIDRVRTETGAQNLALLLDMYHLATNGADLDHAIAEHAHRVGHVQIADVPGRGEPGTGELDIQRHLSRLEAAGYTGWVGLEYQTTTTTEHGLDDWLPRHRRGAQPSL